MGMMDLMKKGFTDRPTGTLQEDAFGVQQYIAGLNSFILDCNTPMTIAIQGDWGSGKTSMMNMIREQLGDKVATTWFNTWQYSQFNMGDALSISFLSRLIADLETEGNSKNSNLHNIMRGIFGFAKTATVIAADTFVGGKVADKVEGVLQAAEPNDFDMPKAINELKEQFQAAVNNKIQQAGKDRLVIFIDDLDRLHPGKAVELMEVLKLFLDCEHCVFVLAIDYAVVSQGVKQKYGELLGEEKGRSFFDKIIQVPFKMPVAQYDVKKYVLDSLREVDIKIDETEVETYVKLIQRSVGCNPRAMKRLFNAFLLLNKISAQGKKIGPAQSKMLFAILCLQLSFENAYNYIVLNIGDDEGGDLLQKLANREEYGNNSEGEDLNRELQLNSDSEIASVVDFMMEFKKVIDQNGDGELSKEELGAFKEILNLSTITANTTAAKTGTDLERHYRIYNRNTVKIIKDEQESDKDKYEIYQSPDNKNPDWKKHYAALRRNIAAPFGKICLEFKIATNLQDQKSNLSIRLYVEDESKRNEFFSSLQERDLKQRYGLNYSDSSGFLLNDKILPAHARIDIRKYFTGLVPRIAAEIEQIFPPVE